MALTYRQNQILEYMKKHKQARIGELAKNLFVSESTIRRELAQMNQLGLVERNHGGAVILDTMDEIAISVRYGYNTQDKKETVEIARNKLPAFKNVFIDNSSTALILTRRIDLRHKTVVTNGLLLAMELSKIENVNILMPGGSLPYNSNALIGAYTQRCLADMSFDLYLASCAAITQEGTFENSLDQAELKRVAMQCSRAKILLVDKTKFGGAAMYRTATLSEYDAVFTNASDDALQPFRSSGLSLFVN